MRRGRSVFICGDKYARCAESVDFLCHLHVLGGLKFLYLNPEVISILPGSEELNVRIVRISFEDLTNGWIQRRITAKTNDYRMHYGFGKQVKADRKASRHFDYA
jgi:hypothetical protein